MAGSIQYIKVARIDARGDDITNTLETLNTIVIPSASVNLEYKIDNVSKFEDYFLYNVTAPTNTNLSTGITSSIQYNVLTTLPSTVNVAGVGFFDKPLPISLGTVLFDPFNLTDNIINTTQANTLTTYFSPPTDLQQQNEVNIRLLATGSLNNAGIPDGNAFIEFAKGTVDDIIPATGTQVGSNVVVNPGSTFNLDMSVTTTINFGEVIYLRIREGIDNFNSTLLTFSDSSVQISSSFYSGSDKPDLVLEPFFESRFAGSDCDVLAGNASQPVANPFLQDIDYSKGSIIPVNNLAIISGSATRGTVPESYYTALSSINLKYNGSKNQSQYVNNWFALGSPYNINSNPGSSTQTQFGNPYNIGNFGQTTPVESSMPYVIFFESFEKTQYYPGGVQGTRTEFKPSYIIDSDLNLIEISNNPAIVNELKQITNPIPRPLKEYNQTGQAGIETFRAISFSPSSSFVGGYTGVGQVTVDQATKDLRIIIFSDIGGTSSGVSGIQDLPNAAASSSGLLFPSSIEFSSIPDLPSKAREILTKNNIISPSDLTS